jgi:hypothetical protein
MEKWDLHVHTPFSLIQHFTGSDIDNKWDVFISDLESLPEEFQVIGINDYLFIEGYKKVLEYKELVVYKTYRLFYQSLNSELKNLPDIKILKE